MAISRKDPKGRKLREGENWRNDGRYSYRYTDVRTGKRLTVYAQDLPELREKEKQIAKDMEDNILTDGAIKKMTLNTLFERYMATRELADTTRVSYVRAWENRVKDEIGNIKVVQLLPSHIKAYYAKLSKAGYAYSTIKYIHNLLYPALEMAVDDDIIRKNPAKSSISDYGKPAEEKEALAINYYNATVWGIHNYYGIATCISLDCQKIRRRIRLVMYNRLRNKIVKTGNISNKYINNVYGKSAQVRYINDKPLCPIGYIRTKHPMFKKTVINKYTEDGRKEIHETLGVNLKVLHELMDQHVICKSIEYMDTRMSIYCAQKGKCAVTGKILEIEEINCHHKVPKKLGGDDDYRNLIIIHSDVHKLIHAKTTEIIEKYFNRLNLTKEMLMKINNLRKLAQREEI